MDFSGFASVCVGVSLEGMHMRICEHLSRSTLTWYCLKFVSDIQRALSWSWIPTSQGMTSVFLLFHQFESLDAYVLCAYQTKSLHCDFLLEVAQARCYRVAVSRVSVGLGLILNVQLEIMDGRNTLFMASWFPTEDLRILVLRAL